VLSLAQGDVLYLTIGVSNDPPLKACFIPRGYGKPENVSGYEFDLAR
jgi:hypothetical protein